MTNKVAASMTASIVIDKSDILTQALKGIAQAQKELNDNKLELLFDVSDDKVRGRLKDIQKELSSKDYIIKFKNQGIEETLKSLDELFEKIKLIISGKAFGNGNGNGIGNFIVDEESLKSVIDLFKTMESHLFEMKKIFVDVGDGEEFSPLLKMINELQKSVSNLSKSFEVGFNLNIDVGSSTETDNKIQSKISNALQAYQRLFEHIKVRGIDDDMLYQKFVDFDINQFDTTMGKLQAYRKFIENIKKDANARIPGYGDKIFAGIDKKYFSEASAAMAQVTRAFNEAKKANETPQLSELFGKTDLTEVIVQLGLIVDKLGEISSTASKFNDIFKDGINVSTSIEEIEKLTNRVKELEEELIKLKNPTSTEVNETNISSPMKDTFQGSKIEEAITNAKELDKTLEEVDIPKESFDDVISKFNIIEEKAQNIVKITKNMRRDGKGNPIESYNVTYRNGSNEIYGESSKPQLLGSNDVLYNAKEAENKKLSEQKEKYEELNRAIDRYITVRKRMARGEALSSDEEESKRLLETINKLNSTDVISEEQYKNAQNRLNSLETSVKDIIALTKSSSIDSMQSRIDAHNKRYVSVNNKPADEDRNAEYQEAINKYKNSIVELEIFLENFKKSSNPVTEESISEWNKLIEKVDVASNALKTFSAAEKGSTEHSREKEIDKITKYLDANTKISKKARKELERYLTILKSGDPSANVQEIHTEWTKVAVAEREAGREGKSFLDLLNDKTIGNRAAQLVSYYLSFTDIIRYAREGINVVKDLNTALTEMRKVSDESISRLKEFQKESFDLAEGIGTTALEIQNSAADFMRLGYSLQEATKLSQDANIYANVGDMEINEATEHMVSSIQAWQSEFKSTTEASEQIINRYNEVGNNFAITSADIGSAMERSAAALKAGGNDLNESIGLITAGNLIQQDADTTANALKVMSLRIRGSKAELEGMGETTDDLAESTSKLREQVKSLTGVDIMLDPNTYKSTAEIIQEIGAVWDNLTDVSQAATLELLAGKTRASTVSGLIENYETIEDVIKSCEESENSALEENQKYIDSVEGRLNLLKSQAQELAFVTIDDEALKKGISLLTDLLSLVTDLIDKIGLLSTVAIGAGGFGFFKNLD